jgi:hypothetical protein
MSGSTKTGCMAEGLASEAYRIRLAHLFDPYLAVSASQIEALPHQITAAAATTATALRPRLARQGTWGTSNQCLAGRTSPPSAATSIAFEISSNASSTNLNIPGPRRRAAKSDANYLALAKLAAIRIWFRFMSR